MDRNPQTSLQTRTRLWLAAAQTAEEQAGNLSAETEGLRRGDHWPCQLKEFATVHLGIIHAKLKQLITIIK